MSSRSDGREFLPPGQLSSQTATALRDLMSLRGVSFKRLAEAVGVSPGHISKMGRGLNRPSIQVAESICQVLDAPAEFRSLLLFEASEVGRYSQRVELSEPKPIPYAEPEREAQAALWESITEAIVRLAGAHMLSDLADEIEGRESYVYIARIRDGLIKIGTSLNPWRRINEFYGDPICILPGGYDYERVLHKTFAEYNRPDVGREVFELAGDLAEFILEHAGEGLLSSRHGHT